MQYAFEEFYDIIRGLGSKISSDDPKVRYLCALVAELAYYHVPEFEIDDIRRAKIIPCEAYRHIIEHKINIDIIEYLRQRDFAESFLIADRGVITVGLKVGNILFIGFRGTKTLFDWQVNFRAFMVNMAICTPLRWHRYHRCVSRGRVHRGFIEESFRISIKIIDKLRGGKFNDIEHVFFCGHSLGGAVAALSNVLLSRTMFEDDIMGSDSVCIFGSPRYCDASFYYSDINKIPTQIQRSRDFVPFIPPRLFGYSDHPSQFDTSGNPITTSFSNIGSWSIAIKSPIKYIMRLYEEHNIETYRRELGITAGVKAAYSPLIPLSKT